MRVGVIGGRGFVGSAFVRYLEKNSIDHSVIGRDNYTEFAGQNFDVIINANGNSKKFLAAQEPLREFSETVVSVQRSLLDFKYRTYVICSTIDVYNDVRNPESNSENSPIDPMRISKYGLHKLLAENLVRNYANSWLIFRCGGFVGPGLKKNSIYDLLNNVPLRVNIDSAYQYLSTDFTPEAIFTVLSKKYENQIFNLCGDGLVTIREVISAAMPGYVVKYFGDNPAVERYEISLEKIKRIVRVPPTRDTVLKFVREVRLASK